MLGLIIIDTADALVYNGISLQWAILLRKGIEHELSVYTKS